MPPATGRLPLERDLAQREHELAGHTAGKRVFVADVLRWRGIDLDPPTPPGRDLATS